MPGLECGTGQILTYMKSPNSADRNREIPRYSQFDLKLFNSRHYAKNLPCVFFRECAIPALAALPKLLATRELLLRMGDFGDPFEYSFRRKMSQRPLAGYVKSIQQNRTRSYAGNVEVKWEDFARIAGETPFGSAVNFSTPRIWLGPRGTVTPLHVDAADNFAFHSFGLKRWLLFPASDYAKLEMFSPWPENLPDFHVSLMDLRKPECLRELKRKYKLSPIELLLRPNDVLYVPRGWAHFVESLEPSFLLNLWFGVNPITLIEARREVALDLPP